MVSVKTLENNRLLSESAIAGGTSGVITRAVCQPLDVLKIRFQLQIEPISNEYTSKYRSIYQAISTIVKDEGLTTLWSGHVPAQFLSISYGVLQFTTFESLSHLCQTTDPRSFKVHKHWINFCNGAIAATLATLVSYPFDTVRTRLIAEHKTNKVYNGIINAFSSILSKEGPVALYKGLLPTLAQTAPYTGTQFAIYRLFTGTILNKAELFRKKGDLSSTVELTLLGNLLAGSFAGFVAKTIIYPFDLIKKRLQIQGFQQYRESFGRQMYCTGLFHCVKLTIEFEGFLALYKGYIPSMVKAVLVSALHFSLYDEVKDLLLRIK